MIAFFLLIYVTMAQDQTCTSHFECEDSYCDRYGYCWAPLSECCNNNDGMLGSCPLSAGCSCDSHQDCDGGYCDVHGVCWAEKTDCCIYRDGVNQICPFGSGCSNEIAYVASEWSPCSSECGFGTRTRDVSCMDDFGSIRNETECTSLAPVTSESCEGTCQYFYKILSDWSSCDTACGEGTKTREVGCFNGAGAPVRDDSACLNLTEPDSTQSCTGTCDYDYVTSEWSRCTNSCGEGIRIRHIDCVGGDGSHVDDSFCNSVMRPPTMESCWVQNCECFPDPIPIGYVLSQSIRQDDSLRVECAEGYFNYDGVPTCMCTGGLSLICQFCERIIYSWATSVWSTCSTTCGPGVQMRNLTCVGSHGVEVDSSFCSNSIRPSEQRQCYLHPCQCYVPEIGYNINQAVLLGDVVNVTCAPQYEETSKPLCTCLDGLSMRCSGCDFPVESTTTADSKSPSTTPSSRPTQDCSIFTEEDACQQEGCVFSNNECVYDCRRIYGDIYLGPFLDADRGINHGIDSDITCAEMCMADPQCLAFTYWQAYCYLYARIDSTIPMMNSYSGDCREMADPSTAPTLSPEFLVTTALSTKVPSPFPSIYIPPTTSSPSPAPITYASKCMDLPINQCEAAGCFWDQSECVPECVIKAGFRIEGNVIDLVNGVERPSECSFYCQHKRGCVSFLAEGSQCWLYSSHSRIIDDITVVSGFCNPNARVDPTSAPTFAPNCTSFTTSISCRANLCAWSAIHVSCDFSCPLRLQTILEGTLLDGGNFDSPTLDECEISCRHEVACIGFSFQNQKCYLYSDYSQEIPKQMDATSGLCVHDRPVPKTDVECAKQATPFLCRHSHCAYYQRSCSNECDTMRGKLRDFNPDELILELVTDSCQSFCKDTMACVSFSYIEGTCYLFNSLGAFKNSSDALSGICFDDSLPEPETCGDNTHEIDCRYNGCAWVNNICRPSCETFDLQVTEGTPLDSPLAMTYNECHQQCLDRYTCVAFTFLGMDKDQDGPCVLYSDWTPGHITLNEYAYSGACTYSEITTTFPEVQINCTVVPLDLCRSYGCSLDMEAFQCDFTCPQSHNRFIGGVLLNSLDTDIDSCITACIRDANCAGYTFHSNGLCQLYRDYHGESMVEELDITSGKCIGKMSKAPSSMPTVYEPKCFELAESECVEKCLWDNSIIAPKCGVCKKRGRYASGG